MNQQKLEIIGTIENAATELKSYITLAIDYAEIHDEISEIHHLGLILDKMAEHIDKLNKLFYENKIPKVL